MRIHRDEWELWRAAWKGGMLEGEFKPIGEPGDSVSTALAREGFALVAIRHDGAVAFDRGYLYFVADFDGWPTAVRVDEAIGR